MRTLVWKKTMEEISILQETPEEHMPGKCDRRRSGRAIVGAVLTVIVALAVVAFPCAADTGAGATNPTVIITGYEVTPAVLMPGDRGLITVTLKNTAESASVKENSGLSSGGIFTSTKSMDINAFIENVHLESNGMTVLTDDFDRLGELGPGQSVPVTFLVQAPANDGIYFPEVWIDIKDGRSTRYPVMVNVNTDIATLKKPALSVLQHLPDRVAPGENCTVTIGITNTGLSRASDIGMTVTSDTASLVLTTPGHSYADHLDPGESTNLTLRFATDKNTPPGIDPVLLSITYKNPDGTVERQAETIGIPVKGKAEIAIKSFSTDPVRPVPGSAFVLTARIENTGTDEATSVRVVLDSPFSGTRTAFIGSIDKSSDAPAIFYLQATEEGAVPVNLTITYSDDFGTHTIAEDATVTTAAGYGLLPVIAILLACIAGGAAFWYFRIRPGKRHGE